MAAQAEALRMRAISLADRDAETYRTALAAREQTAALRPEQRDWAVGRAFAAAAEPPLELARTAADVAELAAEVALHCEPQIRVDVVVAATLALASARGACALVDANLTALQGDPRRVEAEQL